MHLLFVESFVPASTKLFHGFWKNNDNSSCKTYFIRFKMMFWFWNPCLILCLLSNSPHLFLDRSLPVAVLTFRQKTKSIFFYARFANNCPLTIVATDQERGAGSVSFVIREENVWVKFWANVGISATENFEILPLWTILVDIGILIELGSRRGG